MTGRTHDLAAFTALSLTVAIIPTEHMSLSTALVAIGANLIGGLAPDIDQPGAKLWHYIPAGSVIGKIIDPFLGGHRTISHSFVGILLFGFLSELFLKSIAHVLLVNMSTVWWAFMIGYVSHIVMDIFTHEGEPLLFPLNIHFGIPPLKALRIKTGGIIEKLFVFPGLLVLTGYIYYTHYEKFIQVIRFIVKK